MSDPISIVLVGAPGSKKSEVAARFRDLSEDDSLQTFSIVENVAEEIETEFDMAGGLYGSYLYNLLVATRRFDSEMFQKRHLNSWITVGSLIETMAHAARNIEVMSVIEGEQMERRIMREMHTTTVLTMMFLDTFKYDYGFYLPLSRVVLDEVDDPAVTYAKSIDENIQIVFDNFDFHLPHLIGSVDVMADSMFEQIKTLEAKGGERVEVGVDESTAA